MQGEEKMTTIGERLAFIRVEVLRLKQREMIKYLGYSYRASWLSTIECGDRNPKFCMLYRLTTRNPEIDMHWVMTGEGSWKFSHRRSLRAA